MSFAREHSSFCNTSGGYNYWNVTIIRLSVKNFLKRRKIHPVLVFTLETVIDAIFLRDDIYSFIVACTSDLNITITCCF